MEHETEFIPELSAVSVPATPAVPDTRSDVALRRELAFHKNESAKKDDIMRRHGIPTQPVPVAPVAPVAVPVASPAIDPRAVAHEVTGAVHNEIDGLRLEMSELKQGQADILKQLQHAGGFSVSEQGNRVDRVGPPTGTGTEASGTNPGTPADKAATPKTENPDDMPGFGYLPSHGFDSRRWVPMTLGQAEAKGISWRRTNPDDRTSAKRNR